MSTKKLHKCQLFGFFLFEIALLIAAFGMGRNLFGQAIDKVIYSDACTQCGLYWHPNTEPDLARYVIEVKNCIRGLTESFYTSDTSFTWLTTVIDDSAQVRLMAVDQSGNQSAWIPWITGVKHHDLPIPPPANVNVPYAAADFSDWDRLGIVLWENRDRGWGLYTYQIPPDNPVSAIWKLFYSTPGNWELALRYTGSPKIEITKNNVTSVSTLPVRENLTSYMMPLTLTTAPIMVKISGVFFIEAGTFKILEAGVDTTPPSMPRVIELRFW
jgi:hypothetical protein